VKTSSDKKKKEIEEILANSPYLRELAKYYKELNEKAKELAAQTKRRVKAHDAMKHAMITDLQETDQIRYDEIIAKYMREDEKLDRVEERYKEFQKVSMKKLNELEKLEPNN